MQRLNTRSLGAQPRALGLITIDQCATAGLHSRTARRMVVMPLQAAEARSLGTSRRMCPHWTQRQCVSNQWHCSASSAPSRTQLPSRLAQAWQSAMALCVLCASPNSLKGGLLLTQGGPLHPLWLLCRYKAPADLRCLCCHLAQRLPRPCPVCGVQPRRQIHHGSL